MAPLFGEEDVSDSWVPTSDASGPFLQSWGGGGVGWRGERRAADTTLVSSDTYKDLT